MTIPLRHLEAIECEGLLKLVQPPSPGCWFASIGPAVAQAVARNDLPTTQSLTIDPHKPDQQEREDLKQSHRSPALEPD